MEQSDYTRLLEQQANKVFSLFESKNTRFYRTFYIFTGIIGLFFILVFYPYVTLRGSEAVLELERDDLVTAVNKGKADVAEIKQLEEQYSVYGLELSWKELDKIRQTLKHNVSQHDQQIQQLKQQAIADGIAVEWTSGESPVPVQASSLIQKYSLGDDAKHECFWYEGEIWLRCQLFNPVRELHNTMIKQIFPLRRTELHSSMSEKHEPLMEEYIAAVLLKTGSDKQHFADGELTAQSQAELVKELEKNISQLLDEYHHYIHEFLDNIRNDLSDNETKLSDVNTELETVQAKINSMKGLDNISTPLGNIPLGLNDLVLLFPVILLFGMTAYLQQYASANQLRRKYKKLIQNFDEEGVIFNDEHIYLVAPLWVDHDAILWRYITRVTALVLPALLAVMAVILLLANGLLSNEFLTQARFEQWMFAVLYFISFAIGIIYIVRTWKIAESSWPLKPIDVISSD